MEVAEALVWRGGVAEAAWLCHVTSRRRVRTAVDAGMIVRVGRGQYALTDADRSRVAAARLSGVVSHLSAAQLNGWEIAERPALPVVTVPRGRKVDPWRRKGVQVLWRDLTEDDVWNGRTTAGRTIVDCARDLPFSQALAVADSGVRNGNITAGAIQDLAQAAPRTGRRRCLKVAEHVSGKAANPFESVLRAISIGVPGLALEPQVVIEQDGWTARPDLVNVERRLVVEADSFEFHGARAALKRDCERYNSLTLRGWLVLRFSYEHVMFQPDYVLDSLRAADLWRPRRREVQRSAAQMSA
jgi:very-short-patch-repair endonuclease